MSMGLAFNGVQFEIVSRDGQPWVTSRQLALALGYKDENSVRKIYERNKEEFSPMMTATVNMTVGITEVMVRIFSMRGCHLVGMFARTPVAKAFRKWVLDVLDRLAQEEREKAAPSIVSSFKERRPLSRLVDVWAEQVGMSVPSCWTQVNAHLNIESIRFLPVNRIPEAIAFVEAKIAELPKFRLPCGMADEYGRKDTELARAEAMLREFGEQASRVFRDIDSIYLRNVRLAYEEFLAAIPRTQGVNVDGLRHALELRPFEGFCTVAEGLKNAERALAAGRCTLQLLAATKTRR